MSKLGHTRLKIYRTVARQLHGSVPCWVCGAHVPPEEATLEHIQPLSEGGNSHVENLAISHARCNHERHARAKPAGAGDEIGCICSIRIEKPKADQSDQPSCGAHRSARAT